MKLMRIWRSFKRDFMETLNKALTSSQKELYENLLSDFHNVANEAFRNGVEVGNNYFEETFKIRGLTPRQRALVANQQLRTFDERARTLYRDDLQDTIENNPARNPLDIFNSFDRYLLMYANVAASAAYSVFTRNIGLLNRWISRNYSLAGADVPEDSVQIQWILEPTATHSEDCWKLSQGRNGDGIWDARELAAMDIFPKSPLLDCGGNCRCHLRPIAPLDPVPANWLRNLVQLPDVKTVLSLKPNMSVNELLALFEEKNFIMPTEVRKMVAGSEFLRRSEFWDKLPGGKQTGFVTIVDTGPQWRVSGQTLLSRNTGLPARIVLRITVPQGVDITKLTAAQRLDILRTVAHEIGHTVMNTTEGTKLVTLFSDELADALLDVVSKTRAVTLAQVEVNFENIINQLSKASITPQVANDIKLMRAFLQDSDAFMDQMFKAVAEGKTFGGIAARDAWMMFERVLQQYSTGTLLTRGYQLWNIDEFWAEWWSLLLTDPKKAALFSPALNNVVARRMRNIFAVEGRIGKVLLPEAVSIWNRIDIPKPTSFVPIAPNWTSFTKNLAGVRSISKRVSDRAVLRQVTEVVREYPGFLRDEFFDGLKLQFIDRIQMGTRAGSRSFLAYYEPKRGIFFINYDRWKGLTVDQRANVLADSVSKNLLESGGNAMRRQIQQRYRTYLEAALNWIDRKATIQNLGTRDLHDIMDIVFGNKEAGIKPNITFWTRNFNQYFKGPIGNITDLPVLNVESLASPDAFFREWMRMLFTKPASAALYPGFRDIVDSLLKR